MLQCVCAIRGEAISGCNFLPVRRNTGIARGAFQPSTSSAWAQSDTVHPEDVYRQLNESDNNKVNGEGAQKIISVNSFVDYDGMSTSQ